MSGGRRTPSWTRKREAKPPSTPNLEAELAELLDRGDLARAATILVRGYGPELLGYLIAILRNLDWARDVFAQFCEDAWRGLPTFRRECSVRTWCYVLAWNASRRFDRDAFRRNVRRLATSEISEVVAEVTSGTIHVERGRAARLREQLSPYDQTLLILRVDRELSWEEVSRVLSDEQEPVTEEALRKRFERVKAKLRELAGK
jgi:RNA polymerase sigma-70 factor (ECF subfamily)